MATRLLLIAIAAWSAMPLGQDPPAQPQQTPQTPPTFRAGTRTVLVPTIVRNDFGEFVRDLTKDDFEIRDNGKVVPLTFFDREIQPITAIMLLDGSASMLGILKQAIAATNDFVVRMMPGDRLKLGSFAETLKLQPEFSADRDKLLEYFRNEFNVQ